MRTSRSRQRGVALILAVALLASLTVLAVTDALRARSVARSRMAELEMRMAHANAALVSFVSAIGRLPCGANPALDVGTEVRVGGACTYSQGTLPWATLGLRRDDALDPWGFKISYRVYTGPAGSLTQDNGTSMILCDPTQSQNADGAGLCKVNKKTSPASFLTVQVAGSPVKKGLTVTDFGVMREFVAYVLLSHGPSGMGTYTDRGVATNAPTNASEVANMTAMGPFVAAVSATSVGPSDAMHFDDVISYATVSDLITKAGHGPRTWP
ncbi:MAG: hypothetical protein ABIR98_13995 [Usitatibacter sp.]